jgi:hypothetical protein
MKARDIMTTAVVSVGGNATTQEVAKLYRRWARDLKPRGFCSRPGCSISLGESRVTSGCSWSENNRWGAVPAPIRLYSRSFNA